MPGPEFTGWQQVAAQQKLDTERTHFLLARLVGAWVDKPINEIAPWLAPKPKRVVGTQENHDKKMRKHALSLRLPKT